MIIDTPSNGSVTTYSVYLNYPLTIFGRDFGIDLVCLPLSQLDVILGMGWLGLNRIYINCYSKAVLFPEFIEEKDPLFISANHMRELLKDETQVFSMFVALKIGSNTSMVDLPVVNGFPEDITDLSPEREVEFSINLMSSTRPVSMVTYRMSPA